MKQLYFLLLFLPALNCVMMDRADITPDTISGREAKQLILERAIIGSAASGGISGNSILANRLANIQDDRYYKRSAVEKCAERAMLVNFLTSDFGGAHCYLNPHETVIQGAL